MSIAALKEAHDTLLTMERVNRKIQLLERKKADKKQVRPGAIEKLAAERDALLTRWENLKPEIEPMFNQIDDINRRAFMCMRYLHGVPVPLIAEVLKYKPTIIYQRMKEAWAELEQMENADAGGQDPEGQGAAQI